MTTLEEQPFCVGVIGNITKKEKKSDRVSSCSDLPITTLNKETSLSPKRFLKPQCSFLVDTRTIGLVNQPLKKIISLNSKNVSVLFYQLYLNKAV